MLWNIPVKDRLPVGPLEVADDSDNENSDCYFG